MTPTTTQPPAAAPPTIAQAIATTERPHHVFSPSTMQALEACPCYRGRKSTHVKAILGTMQHEVCETGEDNMKLSDDESAAAAECLDFFYRKKQIMEEARLRDQASHLEACEKFPGAFDKNKTFPEVLELSEVFLPVDNAHWGFTDTDPLTGKKNFVETDSTTSGYVDRVIIDHRREVAEMFDWKFGVWPIEDAENNLQGLAYALGLFRLYKTLQKVTFYFKQPVLDSVSQATWTREDINNIYLRILTVVERAVKARESASFDSATPSVPNCLFCANCAVCPKVVDYACRVGSKFYPVEIPSSVTPSVILPPAEAAMGLRLCAVVEAWAAAFKRQNTDRILRGDAPIPDGYKIQDMKKREVVDKDTLRRIALLHMTEAEYEAALDVTLGALESTVNDKAPRGAKKAAVEAFGKAIMDGGAVKYGLPIVFLRAIAAKKASKEPSE
jgi:hypothetical protein